MGNFKKYIHVKDNDLVDKLKKASDNYELAKELWHSLINYPVDLLNAEKYYQAQRYLLNLLHTCNNLDPESFLKIHKGNLYYYLGIASYLIGDYQTAAFFFDASVTEDINGPITDKPTPSMLFLSLDDKVEGQSAKKLTELTKSIVERTLDFYNKNVLEQEISAIFKIDDLRNNFLLPALNPGVSLGRRTLNTTFISFFMEWDYRNQLVELRPEKGCTSEPFYLHLFKGCVLFESLLKENTSKKLRSKDDTLGKVLKKLYTELGMNKVPNMSGTFEEIVNNIPNADNSIDTIIKFTGRVRNTIGHKLSWGDQITQYQYQRLFEMISSSCLHVINYLYKSN